jgi:hypothetical protein
MLGEVLKLGFILSSLAKHFWQMEDTMIVMLFNTKKGTFQLLLLLNVACSYITSHKH